MTASTRRPGLFDWMSPIGMQGWWLRRVFRSAGLKPRTLVLENGSLSCWVGESGDPLLLLHGFGASALWQWGAQVRALGKFYRLIIPDLLFFGGSTSDHGRWSVDFQAETMIQLLNGLGAQRSHLLGMSYGGFVAHRMATIYPERVGKMVLVNSPGWEMKEADYDALLKRFSVNEIHELILPDDSAGVQRLVEIAWHQPPSIPGFALKNAHRILFSNQVPEKKELLRSLVDLLKRKDVEEDLPLHEILVIWGEHDEVFPLELGQRFHRRLGQNAQFELIQGAAHAPNLEKARHFNTRILEFLGQ